MYDKDCICSSCQAYRENERIAKLTKMDKQMNYNKPMTRKEAVSKMTHGKWYGEEGQQGWLLDNLVALGLIEFKTEESENNTMELITALSKAGISYTAVEMELERSGFKIVKA